MTGAGFILLINLAVAGLFCASFVLIALYDRRYRSARWFAAAYAMGMAYAVAEFLLPIFTNIKVGVFVGHMAFLVTLILLNVGLARRSSSSRSSPAPFSRTCRAAASCATSSIRVPIS